MASAHYKQAWVLRSNPELLMTSWKPLIPTPQTTAPVRRVENDPFSRRSFQAPRDNAPGFILEGKNSFFPGVAPRSFLLPKYTYHDGSDFAHHNTSAPHTPPVTTTGNHFPLATPPRHPAGPPPPYPPPRSPIGNLPTTPPPATQGNFGQSSGIQSHGISFHQPHAVARASTEVEPYMTRLRTQQALSEVSKKSK